MRCDLSAVGGKRNGAIVDTAVQEIDVKTGLVRWEWHSLDHVGVSESHVPVPTTATPWDWFHLNSIDPRAERGPADLGAQHVGQPISCRGAPATSCGGSAARTAASRWAPEPKPRGSTTLACSRTGRSRCSTTAATPRVHYQSRGVRRGDRRTAPHRAPADGLSAPRRPAARRQPGQHADASRREPR